VSQRRRFTLGGDHHHAAAIDHRVDGEPQLLLNGILPPQSLQIFDHEQLESADMGLPAAEAAFLGGRFQFAAKVGGGEVLDAVILAAGVLKHSSP
jgi:hypothetical protein